MPDHGVIGAGIPTACDVLTGGVSDGLSPLQETNGRKDLTTEKALNPVFFSDGQLSGVIVVGRLVAVLRFQPRFNTRP